MIKVLTRSTIAIAVLSVIILFLIGGSLLSYDLIGFSLGTNQRDFRVYMNCNDSTADDNTTDDPDFGGLDGGILACSKGVIEWGSELMGNSSWGTGGANFDAIYVGETNTNGGYSGNVMSWINQNGGGVIAYTYPSSGGWQIRMYDLPWVWHDGPGYVQGGNNKMDIQGIICHEYGHALGLDHTSYAAATMYAYASGAGSDARDLHFDDQDGVKAIYGTASGTKPSIDAYSGNSSYGGTMTIEGSNFSTTGNEVWFTRDGSTGSAYKVTGVSSYSSGTRIDVTVPSQARDGMIMVKKNASGHSSLSNVFPFEIGGGGGGLDPVPDAKVNGSDGPLALFQGQQVNFTISLDPGDEAGVTYDWWIWAKRGFNTPYYWIYPGNWQSSVVPKRAIAYGLITLNDYPIGSSSSLQSGDWEFVFAVDAFNNSYEGTFVDSVDVTIY